MEQALDAGRYRACGGGDGEAPGGVRHRQPAGTGYGGGEGQEGGDDGRTAMGAGRGVVGGHLGEPGDLGGSPGEHRNAGEGGGQPAGEQQQGVVPGIEVGALVGEDRRSP